MVDEVTVAALSGVFGMVGVLVGVVASNYFARSRVKEEKVDAITYLMAKFDEDITRWLVHLAANKDALSGILFARASDPAAGRPPFSLRGLPPTVRGLIGAQTRPSSAQRPRHFARKELYWGVVSRFQILQRNLEDSPHASVCFPQHRTTPSQVKPF